MEGMSLLAIVVRLRLSSMVQHDGTQMRASI